MSYDEKFMKKALSLAKKLIHLTKFLLELLLLKMVRLYLLVITREKKAMMQLLTLRLMLLKRHVKN